MKEFEGTTSLLRLHSILNQETFCARGLTMMCEMNTDINTLTFIRASVISHHQFVGLLTKADENGEIIYHTNVRRLDRRVCSVTSFDLLKSMKSSIEKKGKNIEEIKDEGRMIELASFFCGCDWSFE